MEFQNCTHQLTKRATASSGGGVKPVTNDIGSRLFIHIVVYLFTIILMLYPLQALCKQRSQQTLCGSESVFTEIHGLLKTHAYNQAKVLIDRVQSCPNLTPLGRFRIGWLYAEDGDFHNALKLFRSVGDEIPNKNAHVYAVAFAELQLGDYESAIKLLQPLQEDNSLDEASANLLGVAEAKAGHYQEAYTAFIDEIARHPKDLSGYLNMITLLSDAGKFGDAVHIATSALAFFPENPQILISAGAADVLLGKDGEAHKKFNAVVMAEPHDAEARFLLAVTSYRMGQFATAKDEINRSVHDGVVSSDLYYLLAECELKVNAASTSVALAAVNRAVQLNGQSVPALTLRGKLLLSQKRPNAALSSLIAAHHLDPSSHNVIYNLARCYTALGEEEKAHDLYRQLSTKIDDTARQLGEDTAKGVLAGGGSH